MKRNRIVFTICIIILSVIFFEIISYMNNGIEFSELNNMYKDINALDNKIALYYLDYGKLPIIEERVIEFKDKSINPNDNETFYEIDLNKLDNLNLFYGDKILGYDDIYIINEDSHTIYYLKGCTYNGKTIYTRELDYKNVQIEKNQS